MYTFTTTRQLQSKFKAEFNDKLCFKLIPDHSGKGKMYDTTTRCAFVDWIYALYLNGAISERLVKNAYLAPRK